MLKVCHVCGEEKEHKSWKATTCNDCLDSGVKWCSSCETTQPIDNFHLCRGKPMGMCKPCECKRSSQGKLDNGYHSRPEVRLANNKRSAEWHKRDQANADRRREVLDRHNERKRERYANDAEFKERLIEYHRQRKTDMPGHMTGTDWQKCLEYFSHTCAYCGSTENLTRDHVVPVVIGGSNNPNNVIVACRSCNSSKHDKSMHSWYRGTPFFEAARLAKIEVWIGGSNERY